MNTNELGEHKYLTKEDVGKQGVIVTIAKSCWEQVRDQKTGEMVRKWVTYFREFDKGMIVNKTNGKRIEDIVGSIEAEDWVGHQICLYHEPDVYVGNERKGGIRVRPANPGYSQPPAARPPYQPRPMPPAQALAPAANQWPPQGQQPQAPMPPQGHQPQSPNYPQHQQPRYPEEGARFEDAE